MSSLPPKKMAGLETEDLVTEVFSYLPVKFLLRFRAVCKLWRDVIDSPFFRKLHIHTRSSCSYSCKEEEEEDDDDEKVILQLDFGEFGDKMSIKVVEKGKSVDLNLEFPLPMSVPLLKVVSFISPVKGLICFNLDIERFLQPIVICNPFLGQFKILPFSPILASPDPSCRIALREVGIGCDGEFYKVVELVDCRNHDCIHAHLYSRRTDSWRKLDDLDQRLFFFRPVMLSCSDGHFAHWYNSDIMLLTFDMKNEVFSTIQVSRIPSISLGTQLNRMVVKDDNSFIVIIPPQDRSSKLVRIYESSIFEENGVRILSWKHVVDLEEPVVQTMSTPLPLCRRECVMLRFLGADGEVKVLFYDYVARRFTGCFRLPGYSKLFSYKGTFISP